LKQYCVVTQLFPYACPAGLIRLSGEATMRIMEMLATAVVTVGSLALVAGVLSL
jgi:hypothetical protein